MEQNLIHIIDNVKNDQYIYSNCLNVELQDAANNLIADLKKNMGDNIEYEIEFNNNECEIFTKEQVIQNGWIWNSKNTNKLVLYKLSRISVFKVKEKPVKCNQETQTQQTSVKDTFIQTNEKATSKLYSNRNMDVELGDFFDSKDYKFKDYNFKDYKLDIDFGNGYSKNPFDPMNTNPIFHSNPFVSNPFDEVKTTTLLKNIWSVPENDIINVIGEKAVNPFANPTNDLNVEIKRRLALPNFGLRKF